DRPGFDRHAQRDENHARDHRHRAAEAGGDFRRVVVVEIRIERAQPDVDGGDAEGHQTNREQRKRHHPVRHAQQKIAEKNQQLAEREQRRDVQPELAPQKSAERNRRALHDPEGLAFEADRRKREAHGDRAQDKTRERKIGEGNQGAQRARGHGRAVERQHFEIIEIDQDQRAEKKKLRPLGGVAQEGFDVLDHDRAGGLRKENRGAVEQPIEPGELAPSLARLLGLGPAVEINRAGNPAGGKRQKKRVARQQREKKSLLGLPLEQAAGENFRRPAARQIRRRRRFHGAQELHEIAEGLGLHQPLGLRETKEQIDHDEGDQTDEQEHIANALGRQKINQQVRGYGAERGGDDQKQRQDQRDPQIQPPAAAENRAVGGENRQAKKQHHPGGIDRGLNQPGEEKTVARKRRGVDKIEIAREKVGRKRRHQVAEQKQR